MERQPLMTPRQPLVTAHHGASANTTPRDLAPGRVLANRYELLDLVADGGTSRLFRARDLEADAAGAGDPLVALKVPYLRGDQDLARELVRHEGLVGRQLNHASILRVHDFSRDGGVWFLVMEWVVGRPLSEVLQQHPGGLPPPQVSQLLYVLAGTLAHCHQRGVVHCDIKPANILITADGQPKVLDLATARYISGHERGALTSTAGPAFSGHSPAYASPQLAAGAPAQPGDDIYSLACVAHQLLCGHLPRAGEHLSRPRGINRWQHAVLQRALSRDPSQRFASAPEFARALHRAGRVLARWSVAAGVSLTLAGLLASGLYGTAELRADRAAAAAHAAFAEQTATLMARAVEAETDRLPALLAEAASLPAPWRGSALQRLQAASVQSVAQHVERELAALSTPATLGALEDLAASVAAYYPDSARLDAVAGEIARAREASRAELAERFRQAWIKSDFRPSDGSRLERLSRQLTRLSRAASAQVPNQARKRYRHALAGAIDRADFARVAELQAFSRRAGSPPGLIAIQGEFDPAILQAAATIDRYASGQQADFPQASANLFFDRHLAALEHRTESSWSTQVLVAIKDRINELGAVLPAEFEPFARVRENLIQRLQIKERYYAGLGDQARAAYYRRLWRQLADQH